eukprot:7911352-Karenia_brevis.AAC.1
MTGAVSNSMQSNEQTEKVGVVPDIPHFQSICGAGYQDSMGHENSEHHRICVFLSFFALLSKLVKIGFPWVLLSFKLFATN